MKIDYNELKDSYEQYKTAKSDSLAAPKDRAKADRVQATGLAFSYMAKHYVMNVLEEIDGS